MDSPLALGALRIARGAGGEGVDVNGSLVEREKGDEFGIETPASSSTIACGQQKVKGGHGSSTASSTASSSASSSASIITLNLGVGCAPSCWRFSDSEPPGCSQGRRGQFSVQFDNRFSGRGGGVGSPPRAWRGAAGAKKKSVRLASVFPSPPFRSSDFAGPRRPRLYGFHTGTRSLANRKGRGRRRGGREREHRRAGEGRSVWNRNYCVLIDYPS